MIYRVVLMLVVSITTGCADREDDAHRVLVETGYTDIKMTGYRWFGCGEDEAFREGFEATSQIGYRVTGVVCSSFFKSATVRLD